MPNAETVSNGGLAGLAAQAGFSLPTGSVGESPEFYSEALLSRTVLGPLTDRDFTFATSSLDGDTITATVVGLFEAERDTDTQTQLAAIEELRDRIAVTIDAQTSLVTIRVSTRWAALSEQLASALIEQLQSFNLNNRRSRARQEREFVSQRLDEAQDSLTSAEGDLRQFLEANRSWSESPRLSLEESRLQRRIQLMQAMVQQLRSAYEQARIEEVRNTPVITVVDDPSGSAKDSSSVAAGLVVGGLIGGLIAVLALAIVAGRAYTRRLLQQEELEISP
jgi:uncharacterized protein involved in exopolysaccharide biosynthesis